MEERRFNEEDRISGIQNLLPTGEKKSILYGNKHQLLDVFEIPLEYLLYNPYNGRIRSLTSSHESQYEKLNMQDPDDKIIIEQFLYDSEKAKNDKTIDSIKKIGQQEFGIVTKDGVIIDGNRRAMILNILNREQEEKLKFKAVVLPDRLQDNRKEIITLETNYQMGVDSKVDYNPIEKYIRCEELLDFYSIEEIGKQMAEEPKKIVEWLDILSLMKEYLAYLGTPNMYIRLEKREGHFVDLHKYLNSYKSNVTHQSVDWEYTSDDVIDLKNAYFTYIRLGIPVGRARVIARPSSTKSFFCYNEIWREFVVENKKVISGYPEPTFATIKEEFPQDSYSNLINKLDTNWKKALGTNLEDTLFHYEQILGDLKLNSAPLRLLKRAKSTLYQVDKDSLRKHIDREEINLINDIDKVIQLFKSFIWISND